MTTDRRSGWTKLFKRDELLAPAEDILARCLEGIARIFEGGDEQETLREIRTQMKAVFNCDDISIFFSDMAERPRREEGDWVLVCRGGFGEGNRVCQTDATAVPSLVPGKRLVSSEFLSERAVLKAIALSFEEDCFYGCDIENKKVVLIKNPTPEDDLGSGDLSLLAIPLRYHNKVGRVVEKARVGVLALYKTPTQRDVGELEKPLRSLLAQAIVTTNNALRDPVTTLFTERFLRDELNRQLNLHDMTGGKLQGGLVTGTVDTLNLYKQALETAANVDPAEVTQCVSDVLRGVGGCLWKRASEHALGPGADFRCGYPGRMGHEGFGVLLPRLSAFEMTMWSKALAKDVLATAFRGEEHLPSGDVSVSLRVIPFGTTGATTPEAVWKLAQTAVDEIAKEQARLRGAGQGLTAAVNTILVWQDGKWVPTNEVQRGGESSGPTAMAAQKKKAAETAAAPQEVDGLTFADHNPEDSQAPQPRKKAAPSIKAARPAVPRTRKKPAAE